jgi:hydroxyethylthiazole kinase
MSLAKQTASALQQVRQSGPLVQCVTNYVSMDIMANVLIAANMSPAMVHGGASGEAKEFAAIASGVNINLGTLDADWAQGAKEAAEVCKETKKPWVLDPVGFGALKFRTDAIKELIQMGPTVLKGNASEMVTCAKLTYPDDFENVSATTSDGDTNTAAKGVDSVISSDTVNTKLLDEFAKKFGGVVCMTGKHDYITDGGSEKYWVKHSVPMLQDFTASGCALGAIITGFCAVGNQMETPQTLAFSTAQAVAYYTLAGQKTMEDPSYGRGPGSFRQGFLDTLRNLTEDEVETRADIAQI